MCGGTSPYFVVREVTTIDDKEFLEFTAVLEEYLSKEKVFVKDASRCAQVEYAMEIAKKLFPEAKVELEHDPLQMGALIVTIRDFDLTVRGETEINLFMQMVANASNFEIYAVIDEDVVIAILFNGALINAN